MADPVLISVRLRDAKGKAVSVPFRVDDGADVATAQAYLEEIAPLFDLVTDGKMEEAYVTLPLVLPGGIKTDPVANCDIEEGGNLNFAAQNTSNSYTVRIPAIKPALVTGESVVTTPTGEIDDLVQYLLGLSLVASTDEYNNRLSSLRRAKKTFRRK